MIDLLGPAVVNLFELGWVGMGKHGRIKQGEIEVDGAVVMFQEMLPPGREYMGW